MSRIARPAAVRRRGSDRLDGESGQTLVEYALIIALVALAAIVALGFMSGKINSLFSKSGNSLNGIVVADGGSGEVVGPPPPSPPVNGTAITLANTTAYTNADGAFYPAGTIQQCSPDTGLNALACIAGSGFATWGAMVGSDAIYAVFQGTRSGACSFTFDTGYIFSGTWNGHESIYRIGTSGGADFGEACF